MSAERMWMTELPDVRVARTSSSRCARPAQLGSEGLHIGRQSLRVVKQQHLCLGLLPPNEPLLWNVRPR